MVNVLSSQPAPAGLSITLDQLAALNDEMAALARAGVPLDRGLLHVGGELPGRLGRITREFGQRLEQGETIEHVLDDPSLPPAYRAVIAAGIRSGRLAVALEGVSTVIRRAAETRRMVLVSLVYPLIVITVAYQLFAFMVIKCFPVMLAAYQDLLPGGRGLAVLQWIENTAPAWLPWLPPAAVVVLVVWWLRSRSAWRLEGGLSQRGKSERRWRFPTVGKLLHAGRMATLADTLALLIEHDVPYHEALLLAAGASGDRRFREAVVPLAQQMERGELISSRNSAGSPPLLICLLAARLEQPRMVSYLRRSADSYRQQAEWLSRWLSIYLPFWLTVSIGGTATAVYVVSVIGPWYRMLYELSAP